MDMDLILRLLREALFLTLMLCAPTVLAAMVVGLVISLIQGATQLQEQTLTVVPKIVAVFTALAVGGLWMVRELTGFARLVLELIPNVQ